MPPKCSSTHSLQQHLPKHPQKRESQIADPAGDLSKGPQNARCQSQTASNIARFLSQENQKDESNPTLEVECQMISPKFQFVGTANFPWVGMSSSQVSTAPKEQNSGSTEGGYVLFPVSKIQPRHKNSAVSYRLVKKGLSFVLCPSESIGF